MNAFTPGHPASTGSHLVADRECGDCKVCCVALRIDEPALRKPAGTACKFLGHAGCTIYEARPSTCRHWLCGWRLQPQLGDAWRPDRSGVLLIPQLTATTGFGAKGYTVQLVSHAPLASPDVLNTLCGFIAGATPIYLSLTSHPTKVLLNTVLAPLVAAGNGPAIVSALAQLVRELTAPA